GESKGGALLKVTNGVPDGKRIDAERLFDRFYTADRSRSGRTSGLGLSIVRVLAEQLGGEVTARQVAAGAPVTISVWLPHVAGACRGGASAALAEGLAAGHPVPQARVPAVIGVGDLGTIRTPTRLCHDILRRAPSTKAGPPCPPPTTSRRRWAVPGCCSRCSPRRSCGRGSAGSSPARTPPRPLTCAARCRGSTGWGPTGRWTRRRCARPPKHWR